MVQSKILNNIPGIKHSFLNATSLPPEGFFHCHQVHGVNILQITSLEKEKIKSEKADGLFTGNNCTLGIQTADCIPALFSSRNGKSIAAIHAGWRGVNLGILQHALKIFAANGVLPKDVFVALGPAIGPCCFEVGPDVIEAFRNNWGELDRLEQYIRRRNTNEAISTGQATIKGSGYFLDLKHIAVEQIKKSRGSYSKHRFFANLHVLLK